MNNPSELSILEIIFTKSKKAFLYIGLFSFFVNILMLTVPLYMMQMFDRVLAGHSYQTLFFLTLIAVLALLTLSAFDLVRARIAHKIASWFDQILSPAALLFSPDQILKGNPYPQMVLRDIAQLKQFISSNTLFILFDAPWSPIYLIVIALISPELGLIATGGALILFALAILHEFATRSIQNKSNDLSMMNIFSTTNTLRQAEAIQAMGMLKPLIRQWQEKNEIALEVQERANKISGIFFSLSRFIRLTLQILILAVGAYLVLNDEITSGMMIAGSILMSRALAPVEQAIGAWKQYQSTKQILARLRLHFKYLLERGETIQLPRPTGLISLENVYYSSGKPGAKFIINNVQLDIQPGEMIGLIGPSAAGKTTLARLICGILKPLGGTVRVDGADVYYWDRADFGQYIGYLPQDIELFTGSLKSNIARLGEVDDEKVIKAAKLAGCHELILALPKGYETEITPGNAELSGGQKQRIALARALYGDPQIVVLDEPNSNLDTRGEIALQEALITLKQRGATLIVVAHRPAILQQTDRIVVLNEGIIQMVGPRDQVIAALKSAQTANPKSNYQQGTGYGVGQAQ